MSPNTYRLVTISCVSFFIVLMIGGDSFLGTPTISTWWPAIIIEIGAAIMFLACLCALFNRFVEWFPGAYAGYRRRS